MCQQQWYKRRLPSRLESMLRALHHLGNLLRELMLLSGQPVIVAVSVVQPQQARLLCFGAPSFMLQDGRGTPHG